ncbi:SRPBCC family protein [Rhodococcus sp. BP-252]|uniref:Dimethyladenosine transferase n=1 Tax=Rhodococcoides kyotonense TaxID=398843 RepID=A0A177YPW8_9NOCA|nr:MULTISPECIES: SRPBCC family protein [Rhodococcus]MBY6411302.1 SRPBCC family protein [Rhodococcus sp. BP-320]MBY6415961.1 SRPBCC family protein [Rhodococcus sp. BP-321]MBY6420530.1 SRPBCC family protein [Rhodococcus sp. BP-324]MBY6426168.1 SRPBCC family protein [Rhodococcus sp. BP-323]MBY6431291.1 SRPBCC family protein [Rhodococcus sp. BP-322]
MVSIRTIDRGDRVVARQVDVNASAEELFAKVANPHRHGELDGSGTVKDTVNGPDRLSRGAKFSVGMKQYGVPYKITSTVTDFVDESTSKVVEWRHPMGHTWRWEFDEKQPGVTTVTESFQYGTAKAPKVLEIFKMPQQNAKGISSTLEKLARQYA